MHRYADLFINFHGDDLPASVTYEVYEDGEIAIRQADVKADGKTVSLPAPLVARLSANDFIIDELREIESCREPEPERDYYEMEAV